MAGPYSKDLRSRVLAAIEAGETPEAAAERFAVARSTAYRWAAAARDEGRREAKPMGGGPAPRIRGAAEAVMLELAGRPDHLRACKSFSGRGWIPFRSAAGYRARHG